MDSDLLVNNIPFRALLSPSESNAANFSGSDERQVISIQLPLVES